MFAKFPNLPDTGHGRTGQGSGQGEQTNRTIGDTDAAGHGSRQLDWGALRARLDAERDLRGSLEEAGNAQSSWMLTGSFDPVAAEVLCGQHDGRHARTVQAGNEPAINEDAARLPDTKASADKQGNGHDGSHDRAANPPGTSVED